MKHAPRSFVRRIRGSIARSRDGKRRADWGAGVPGRAGPALLVLAFVVLTAGAGCGGTAVDDQHRSAARALEIRVDQLRVSSPTRAASAALEADLLDSSSTAELSMLDVAAGQQGVARVIAAHRGPALAATRTRTVVVSSGADGYMRTWDPTSGRRLGQVRLRRPIVRLVGSDQLGSTVVGIDRTGRLTRWDLSEPSRPRPLTLPGRSRRTVALAISPTGATIITVTAGGRINRWDLSSGQPLAALALSRARGHLPWGPTGPRISAAEVAGDSYDPKVTLTAATVDGAVATVDLTSMRGRTILPRGKVNARVTDLATMPYADYGLVLGTTQGTRWWDAKTQTLIDNNDGSPIRAVDANDDETFIGGDEGLQRVPDGPGSQSADLAGPPVRSLQTTSSGTVAANADGTIALLGHASVGIERDPGPPTAIIASATHRRLLVSDGADPNHVDHLALVSLDGRRPDRYEWGRAERVYRPASQWWPHGDGQSTHWFVSGALITERFVIAGGQDPTGEAVVLVWNARTGRPLARLPLSTGGVETASPSIVTGLSVSHDGGRIAAYNPVQESFAVFSTKRP